MTKSDLVARMAVIYPFLTARDVERIVSLVFDTISDHLTKKNGRVELRNFGTFSVRQREATSGYNPRSGEKIDLQPRKMPFFKAGKALKSLLNEESEKRS